jgi:diguanylate cyclase (GGDEF)-like protein
MLGTAAIVVAAYSRTLVPLLRVPGTAAALCVALVLFVVLLRINVPMMSYAYKRRRRLEPGRITMELPVVVTVSVLYGPIAVALLILCGYALARSTETRSHLLRRMLDGGAEAFLWLGLSSAERFLFPMGFAFSPAGYGAFLALYLIGIGTFLFAVWMPLRALAKRALVVRLWRHLSCDTRLLTFLALLVSWGYVCTIVWERAGSALGLAVLAPLPLFAGTLRSLHLHRLDLHRLRLARDAVQAMLGARDPLPLMRSILASLHAPSLEETLQIYAAISPGDDRLAPLATIGPPLHAEQLEACRRILIELQHGDRFSATYRVRPYTIAAYAVRSANDRLLGALVACRPARSAPLMSARRFLETASELAPLLRDFRAIAATQNAAAIDSLTGLPNRRTIMDCLRAALEHAGLANPCAVLIVDIDRFKRINDTMGHQAGDRCLRLVAQTLLQNVRSADRTGRIGGEEFVVMMPSTDSQTALAVGERLREAIAGTAFQPAGGHPLTVSIGMAVAAASETVETLLERADRALYQAKREGRNRVVEIGA